MSTKLKKPSAKGDGLRAVEVTSEQSRMIVGLQTRVDSASHDLALTVAAILAGHGLSGKRLVSLDTDKHILTVQE